MSGLFVSSKSKTSSVTAVGALNVQTSSYGVVVPLCYGTNRLNGNMLWYDDFQSYAHTSSSSGGGKGGGGAGGSTSYTYSASFIFALAEGTVVNIGQVFESKNLTTLSALGGALFTGAQAQSVWGFLAANHPNKALNYSNLATVNFANYDLADSADTPNLSYELFALYSNTVDGYNANPADIILDFLPRTGFSLSYFGDITAYRNYAGANGMFMSPFLTQQKAASEYLKDWSLATNSEFIWDGSLLSIVPYGDSPMSGNGYSFTPNLTPIYALTEDDFIHESTDDVRVQVTYPDMADAYNQQPVEYIDRTNSYNKASDTVEESGLVDMYGARPASSLTWDFFTDKDKALQSARLLLWRTAYNVATYNFKLGIRHILLNPMDLVTITESRLGFANKLVRITSINMTDADILEITAEDMLGDVAAPVAYPSQIANRYTPNYNSLAGTMNNPVIFEPPILLLQSQSIEIWAGVSGTSASWGGCKVYQSTDNNTFQYLDTINGSARQGVLRSSLAAASAGIDTANTLQIDMTESLGVITSSPSQNDAIVNNTLSYVDGELLSFGAESLVGSYQYNLTYLNRGAYGSASGAHAAGSNYLRLDNSVLKIPVDLTRIGQTIYLKFVGFNQYAGGLQDISTVPSYAYKITGSALKSPLPTPANLTTNFVAGITRMKWDSVVDIRTPIDYEVRKGTTAATAQTIGRFSETSCNAQGDGTYWVFAHYQTPTGDDVYSGTPASIAIVGAALVSNVIQTWDEQATGWTGSCYGGAISIGGVPELAGAGNFLSSANILAEPDILWMGGVTSDGYYEIPSGHIVNLAYSAPCNVGMSWSMLGVGIHDNFLTISDVLNASDILGAHFNGVVSIVPEVALSSDGVTYGSWQKFQAGTYNFKAIKARLHLKTFDNQTTVKPTAFTWFVDVPDRLDQAENVPIAAGGTAITYATPFNVTPNVQITILGASAGDDAIVTASTVNGFTVQVMNGGSGVARNVNWTSQKY